MLNRDEILREMILRICSSLGIKETLRNAFEYLREHFPFDGLILFILDERMGATRHIAHAFYKGAVPPDAIVPLRDVKLDCSHNEFIKDRICSRNWL